MFNEIDDLPSDPDELRQTISDCDRWIGYVNDEKSKKVIANFKSDVRKKLDSILGMSGK